MLLSEQKPVSLFVSQLVILKVGMLLFDQKAVFSCLSWLLKLQKILVYQNTVLPSSLQLVMMLKAGLPLLDQETLFSLLCLVMLKVGLPLFD